MAVPSLVANSPSAGYISWSAFHITYNGVSYSVPASNTNARFTAWLYNGGSPLLATNDNTPLNAITDGTNADWSGTTPILGPDDLLLFVNKNGVPINVQNASLVDGDIIVSGTITSAQIAAGTITANNIGAGQITGTLIAANTILAANIAAGAIGTNELAATSVTAAKIAAGTITATQIAAGAITTATIAAGAVTADKVVLGGAHELVADGSFSDVNYRNGITAGVTGALSAGYSFVADTGTTFAAQFVATGSTPQFAGIRLIPVNLPYNGGRALYVSFDYMATATANSNFVRIIARCKKADGTTVDLSTGPGGTYTKDGAWHTVTGVLQPPSDTVSLSFLSFQVDNATAGTYAVRRISVRIAVDGSLIVAGAIDGQTITGAVIQSASTGNRVLIHQNTTGASMGEILFYNSSNAILGSLTTATDGFLALTAANQLNRISVDNTGCFFVGFPSVAFNQLVNVNTSPLSITADAATHRVLTLNGNSPTQSANYLTAINGSGTTVAAVTSTGNVQGTGAYTTLSDRVVKSDIRYLTDRADSMAAIQQLKPVRFKYKDNLDVTHVGFIAQDVSEVLPEAVLPFGDPYDETDLDRSDDEGGTYVPEMLGLKTDVILAHLVLAVQDLDRRLANRKE